MKPTCPTFCPLKKKIAQRKRAHVYFEETQKLFDKMNHYQRCQFVAYETFLYFRHKGLANFSTWIYLLKGDFLFFVWGFFESIVFTILK